MARIDSARLFELMSSTTQGGKNLSWRRGQAPQECGWNLNSDKTDIFLIWCMQNSVWIISKS